MLLLMLSTVPQSTEPATTSPVAAVATVYVPTPQAP